MALLVRAFIVEKINGWDETALYNYLHANPSLRRKLGFETLPAFTRLPSCGPTGLRPVTFIRSVV